MPIHEYKCPGCGRKTEVLSKAGASEVLTCSECGADLIKIVSASNFKMTHKQSMGKSAVNWDVDTPQEVIKKQLKAASDAGHFDTGVRPDIKRMRIEAAEIALKSAPDVESHARYN